MIFLVVVGSWENLGAKFYEARKKEEKSEK
jgi:hypothetical protein